MSKILILTASYGSGHNAAARCLAEAFERAGVRAIVVDHFRELVHPLFDRASRALYYAMLRRAPFLWGAGYALGDWLASDSPLTLGLTRIGSARLAALLARETPDAVVTVHATPTAALSALAARGVRVPSHTTVITDFVAHSQWMAPGVDRYCVAAPEVKRELVARGLPAERIVVTGIPVRPEFSEPASSLAARQAFELSASAPVVLAMAGAHGAFGRLPHVAQALARLEQPVQGVLVAGRDAQLRARLEQVTAGTGSRALGYVGDVRRLMAAADILVTKAGGMTLAEAIAAETPVLVYGSLPGQERRNERFVARSGMALVARSPRQLAHALGRALGEPELLERMRLRMARLARRDATRRIVELVLEGRTRPAHP